MKTYRDLVAEAKRAVPEVTVEDVQARLARGETFGLIDVRDPDEYREGAVQGSVPISRGFLEFKVPEAFQRLFGKTRERRTSSRTVHPRRTIANRATMARQRRITARRPVTGRCRAATVRHHRIMANPATTRRRRSMLSHHKTTGNPRAITPHPRMIRVTAL